MKKLFLILAIICFCNCQFSYKCPTDGRVMKCSLQEAPVCGVAMTKNGYVKSTFVNHCIACSIGKVAFSVEGKCEDYPNEAHLCHPDAANQLCTEDISPSCGYFNQNVRCFVAPCNIQSTNSCEACKIDNVMYTIKGQCSKN